MALNSLQYPLGTYASEQPMWLKFIGAPYSLKKEQRTRDGIAANSEIEIYLPLPKDPGYTIAHEFSISNDNPVAPIISMANIANSGANMAEGTVNLAARLMEPAAAYYERFFATSTYRRFSNLTELTMVSEGRKQYFFQYIFAPRSEDESIQVERICATFRNASYPTLASNLPERTYPQGLWTIDVVPGNVPSFGDASATFLGEPLPCLLKTVTVKKNDSADPVTRFLPNGASALTLLGLVFQEFETGTYDPNKGQLRSKSEIANDYL
jgi:hypothetical protein